MNDSGDFVRVGVLSIHNSKETKAICNAIEDLGHKPEWLREENTSITIENGAVVIEPEIDVIANRLLLSNSEQPGEELGLAMTFSRVVPMLNKPAPMFCALHKFASAAALANAGIPVPDAVFALDTVGLNHHRADFGDMAVYKTAIGTHGGGTWKVGTDEDVNAKVGNRRAFLQDLIERDGHKHQDLRVYVVGDEVIGAMNRFAPEHDWRTNVALGGAVTNASNSLPDRVREIAIDATHVIGLDYAGVDIVQGNDGWFVLEVNPTAGFKGLYEATGQSAAPYVAQLAIEFGGGEVDSERVHDLAATLDDSTPSCKPAPRRTFAADSIPIIGYTEEVIVSGTSGTETVLAKSDTGATRTSIDTSLAAAIGAGPITDITRIKSGSMKSSKTRPVVDIVIGIGGNQHTVTASVEDRGHMDYPLLLGRDILKNYQVDVRRRAEDEDETEAEIVGLE